MGSTDSFNVPLPLLLTNKPYFCPMLTKKYLSFLQLLTLLLLTTYSVAGTSMGTTALVQRPSTENLNDSESDFHRNMLQQQVVHLTAQPEQGGKLLHSGFGILPVSSTHFSAVQPTTSATTILQDVNRCESVSRLLFPYHFFW